MNTGWRTKSTLLYCAYIACVFSTTINCARISQKISYTTPLSGSIEITIDTDPQEILIAPSLMLTAIDSDITVGKYTTNIPSKTIFDEKTKQNIDGFSQRITISAPFTYTQQPSAGKVSTLSLVYMTNSSNKPIQTLITLSTESADTQTSVANTEEQSIALTKKEFQPHTQPPIGIRAHIAHTVKKAFTYSNKVLLKGKSMVSKAVEHTSSLPIRLIFVYLLGLLMSLTPCIYPMIPITMGVLQASKQSSLLRNFLLASTYTAGLATTFAMLGLLAAYGGAQFGALLGNPWFIAFLVAFFVYLALAMFGFYEIQMPAFLRTTTNTKGGGYISAFFFGAFGGTIASPCVSPGLMLVLGMVATLKSSLLGFAYLFLFGCGIGTPLLILGTFSNTLSMAPRAGMWMIEIKKIFGILLIIMAISYASAILPSPFIYAMYSVAWFAIGAYYIVSGRSMASSRMSWYTFIVGTLLFCASGLSLFMMVKQLYTPKIELHSQWLPSYDQAKEKALVDNKKLLIKCGASWCSACTALGKRFESIPAITTKLDLFVLSAIDCTQQTDTVKTFMKKFDIKGLPTVLIIDPTNETVIKRFGSELLEKTDEQLIETLRSCCKEVVS
jgi:thiol:disulfide interchange protein DsbD